eukprot:m51a1_g5961 hypothetical protein (316) ;mRNA; r:164542-165578
MCGRAPIAMICFQRPALLQVIEGLKDHPEYEVFSDEKLGLVLRAPSGASVVAERLDYTTAIDPMTGWTYESAIKLPATGLVESGAVVVRGPLTDLLGALAVSRASFPAFFALMPRNEETSLNSLRPVPYPRLTPEEYAAALNAEPQGQQGVQQGPLPISVVGAFVLDPAAEACVEVHQRPYVMTGNVPHVGDGLFIHVALRQGLALPWVRMAGSVAQVGDLPAEGAPADPAVGDSFFKTCQCGKVHTQADLLKELGTVHGQRIKGVVYLTPEFTGRLPELNGQYEATFVADDHKQFLWQLERMVPLPREQWVQRS